MSRPVNPPARQYRSPLREQRAEQTRSAILDAAGRLFTADGYMATRLADIAAEAGVSVATVKLVFGTKPDLLLQLWHRTLAGGLDDGVPVVDRPWHRAVLALDDPAAKLIRSADNSILIKSRIASLIGVIEDAAPADAALAALWTRMQDEYHAHTRVYVEDLHRGGHLRPELTVEDATDILWTLNHPRTYLLLIRDRGWTPERYAQWLAGVTQRELLPPDRWRLPPD